MCSLNLDLSRVPPNPSAPGLKPQLRGDLCGQSSSHASFSELDRHSNLRCLVCSTDRLSAFTSVLLSFSPKARARSAVSSAAANLVKRARAPAVPLAPVPGDLRCLVSMCKYRDEAEQDSSTLFSHRVYLEYVRIVEEKHLKGETLERKALSKY